MIKEAIQELIQNRHLSSNHMEAVMEEIMTGSAETAQIVSFLEALAKKGESAEELTAAVSVMRRYVTKIHTKHDVVLDTCGTGGDRKGTFNISTVAAFVACGTGVTVAKHGNRSVSSSCGSADILEELGININMGKERIEDCLDNIGIAFLFAQALHPAMKYAMPARRQIGKRTIFNILGPLANPAGATHQLIGVYDARWLEVLAQVLLKLGTKHALIVHSEDGLDEIATTATTKVFEAYNGRINNYEIDPREFGFKRAGIEDLSGGSAADNAGIMLDILKGKPGPKRDIVLLNSGAAIYVSDKARSIKEGVKLAEISIDSGAALHKFQLFRECSNK